MWLSIAPGDFAGALNAVEALRRGLRAAAQRDHARQHGGSAEHQPAARRDDAGGTGIGRTARFCIYVCSIPLFSHRMKLQHISKQFLDRHCILVR
jgi:hypothetical protein